MKYTKGPWQATNGEGSVSFGPRDAFQPIDSCGCCFGPWIQGEDDERGGNARLVALAPDMYALLLTIADSGLDDAASEELSRLLGVMHGPGGKP